MTVWVHGIRFSFLIFKWKNEWPFRYFIVIYFSCLAKRYGFQGLNLKRQINICFLFFEKRMAVKLYICIFTNDCTLVVLVLHDLVLSRLAELPSYVSKCYCLNSIQSEKIKKKLWPNLFGKRNRGSNIVLKITSNTEKKLLVYQIRV